ncbi:hypothetical protein [Rhizosaccharibacter radicis]|uniref:Lipoprotein n=1 Tax=Rhizosaccharibacter radicis TaxID=2782605 RepID=A0ABT1VUH7_9PROT|nr:hypothetical protein [Acetobacteraceae bacterium KSS12]
MTRRAFPVLLPSLLAVAISLVAVPGGAEAARHSRTAEPNTGPVVLTQQPGTALDQAARQLNADDLASAAKRNESPVVLVGSAPLAGTGARQQALFVQIQSASLCGSAGCSTSVYLRRDDGWTKVLDSVSGPVKVSTHRHKGVHDLIVGDHDRWIWNGTTYQDTLPAAPIGNLRQSVERHQAAVKEKGAVPAPR